MSTPSYAAGPTDVPLLEETIGEALRRTAAGHATGEALVDVPSGRRWTWAQLDAAVDDLARALLDAGLQPGDRLGIWAPNSAEWTLTQFATARVGVVLVTVNPAYRTSELEFVLQQSGCRWLVAAPGFKTSDYRAMVAEVRDACPALERVVFLGDDDWHQLAAGGTADLEGLSLSNTDPVNLQYTSGTTGFPKGATLSHRNILNNGYFVGLLCRYTPQDRICLPVPFYHCFGMVMGNLAAVTHGATMVIPSPAFDPVATLRAVQDERCTSLYGVPTMFIAELGCERFGEFDLGSLRTGIMAGSPCPVEVMKRVVAEMHMEQVTICYGMTETSPVSCQSRVDDDLERRVSTVGTVHPHLEVQVVDPDTGLVVPRGRTGELCTRGYSVMLGYWGEPDKTAEAVDADGWMHTGDLAVMDDAGYLNVVGRNKDMVIRGGENVYPREIEEFLYSHPAIEDVQVVGVPDPRLGEELCAWVRLKPGESLTDEELRAYCTGRLAHYKVPRYLLVTDEFPMTVTGKVQKFRMRDDAVARLGLAAPLETA
ncbi:MAG: AMP-binding protein [Frankiales bacterium]|nr:AMP-binding protein [Frankiales bacterium]